MENFSKKVNYGLRPDNHLVMLIAYQYSQLSDVESSTMANIVEKSSAIANLTYKLNVPVILTNTFSKKELILDAIQSVYPDRLPVFCSYLDAWKERRVTDSVRHSGKRKIVLAGLLTEDCLQMTALSAINSGYEVYIITDASGGYGLESHQMSLETIHNAGGVLLSTSEYECLLNFYSSLGKLCNMRDTLVLRSDSREQWPALNFYQQFPLVNICLN